MCKLSIIINFSILIVYLLNKIFMKNFFIVLCTFLLLPSIVHAAPATNYGCRVEGNLEEIEGGKNRLYTAISYTLDSGDVYDIPFSISMQTDSGSLRSYSGEVDLYYTGESVNQFDRTEITINSTKDLNPIEIVKQLMKD